MKNTSHPDRRLRAAAALALLAAGLAAGCRRNHAPADGSLLLSGRIHGQLLQAAGGFEAGSDGNRLRVLAAGTTPAALAGAEFERCAG